MNEPEDKSHCQAPTRKPIILIGAPSGTGKTVLSRKIVSGAFPLFNELCRSTSNDSPISYGLKVLPNDLPCDRALIIECSTYKFERLTLSHQWQRMLALIRESELVIHVNLEVPRRTVVRQYFQRIFSEPKRMHPLYRILQLSKYRTTLVYMLTRELIRSDEAWRRFGISLTKEMPTRTAIVRARRTGAKYTFDLEEGLVQCPAQSMTTTDDVWSA